MSTTFCSAPVRCYANSHLNCYPESFGAHLRAKGEERTEPNTSRLHEDVTKVLPDLVDFEQALSSGQANIFFKCRLYRLPPILFLFQTDNSCYIQQYYFWQHRELGTPTPMLRFQGGVPMHEHMKAHFDWIWENASVAANDFLNSWTRGYEKALHQCSVVNVLQINEEVRGRMEYLLTNAKTYVRLLGFSLKAFFLPDSSLLAALRHCFLKTPSLDIRILLIDPQCDQAYFRSYRESGGSQDFKGYRAQKDKHQASDLCRMTAESVAMLRLLMVDARQASKAPTVKVGLYASSSVCFMLQVDNGDDETVLVEQYHYGKHVRQGLENSTLPAPLGKDMPLVEYSKKPSPQYSFYESRSPFASLASHFDFVFSQSEPVVIEPETTVGGASAGG